MSYTGTIENGIVKLPPEISLPDGTKVRVEEIKIPQDQNELTRKLREIAAQLEGLPGDWAQEHDHYIHGTPKRGT
jgi:predicted DNA-binding antitoxin AbrB/MazE fold protein